MTTPFVDFFIVGAMRSGTSSIRDALGMNPHIDMAKGEPKFFNNEKRVAAGVEDYHGLFDKEGSYLSRGEKSPPYAVSSYAPRAIAEYNPNAKIVWMFRDPVERAISHYAHSKYRTDKALSLRTAIEQREELERARSTMAYVFRSEYQKHLTNWLEFFPRKQHFLLILEEVISAPDASLADLHEFLEVPMHDDVRFPHAHRPQVKAALKNETDIDQLRPMLRSILMPTIAWMEEFLGRSITSWR